MSSKKTGIISPPQILGLVVARQGSKGIPGKNEALLRGVPTAYWALIAGKKSKNLSKLILSTDSLPLMQSVSRLLGPETVPFLRPDDLGADNTSSVDVAIHALTYLSEELALNFEHVLLIEPSSPLRDAALLDDLVEFHLNNLASADASVICSEATQHPEFMLKEDALGNLEKAFNWIESGRRQETLQALYPTGQGYIVKSSILKTYKTFYPPRTRPYRVPVNSSHELDVPEDWPIVHFLASKPDYDYVALEWEKINEGQL